MFTDPARRDAYLKMYGNICYDTPRPVPELPVVVGGALSAYSNQVVPGYWWALRHLLVELEADAGPVAERDAAVLDDVALVGDDGVQ